MGWANCGTDSHGRPIGYAHAAQCDAPNCNATIDRGLSYACGGMHGEGEPEGSCEGYFCEKHLFVVRRVVPECPDPGWHYPVCIAVCEACRELGDKEGLWDDGEEEGES